MFKHILLATDGSDLAQAAVDQGLELAQRLDARVTAITATETLAPHGCISHPVGHQAVR